MGEGAKNTKEQAAVTTEAEAEFKKERTLPRWRVELSGDDVEWAPRADERFWKPETFTHEGQEITIWVSKDGKPVIRPARRNVELFAATREVAGATALADASKEGYHTIDKITEIKD